MALIAALSGSRRHSSARPALSQPRCTGRDIHSPKSREVKFSRRDGVRPPVGLRRKGSKPAIASHKNCRRAGVHGRSWWLFRTFQLSVDQLIVLTLQALSALAQVRCVGRTRNIRGGGMTDASFLVPIRRIQVIAVGIQMARSQPTVAFEAGFGKAGENVLALGKRRSPAPNDNRELGSPPRPARSRDRQPAHIANTIIRGRKKSATGFVLMLLFIDVNIR
jgi:hypothetical protein